MKKYLVFVLATTLLSSTAVAAESQADFNKKMDSYLSSDDNVGKIGDALERFFKQKRAEQEVAGRQAEEQEMEEQFKNPVKIEIGDSPVKGDKNAPITVVEFSDFQCPFCKRGMDVMDDLLKEYPKDVKVVFKNLPLPFHNEAVPAAIAALAAGKQGKFWEMHDALFNNQSSLGDAKYLELAKKISLDVEQFKKDIKDPALAKQVKDEADLATKLGVRGTPGFFVNGVQVRGARPLPYFKQLVDRWKVELSKK